MCSTLKFNTFHTNFSHEMRIILLLEHINFKYFFLSAAEEGNRQLD